MSKLSKVVFLCLTMSAYAGSNSVVWNIDNLKSIGGHKTKVVGTPKVIKTENGKAVQFDGIGDGLVVEALPLADANVFTIEVIFRPDVNGQDSQRLIYMQEKNSKNRIAMAVETRAPDKNSWHFDTYVKCNAGNQNSYRTEKTHKPGQWYNAALVYDGQKLHNYLNGTEETSEKFLFEPLKEGETSIGVKLDHTAWFKGVIRQIRFTRSALPPQEFLKP